VLSQRRAEAVREALIGAGVDAGRITAIGAGASQPVAGNDTAQGRARNRRVEVILDEH
jgi:outer membrane protein OmpA-like peptidoglycan-associated protein